MTTHQSLFLRWPPGKFFWAVLYAPGLIKAGPLPEALYPEQADLIPVPIEEVFAVAAPTTDRRLLACAIRRTHLEDLPPGLGSFTPDSVPESLGVTVEASWLNFMVGEYEPKEVRRQRARRHGLNGAVVLLAAALMSVGLTRRAAHLVQVAERARAAAAALAQSVVPGVAPAQAPWAIDQELSRLREHARAAGALTPPPDASVHLASLLEAWPAQVSSKPQALSVSPTSMIASVSLDGDPAAFLRSFRAPGGWSLDEPRVNSSGGLSRVSLIMKPAKERHK